MTRLRRLVTAAAAVLFLGAGVALGGGFLLFNRPHADPLSNADAIVVLGGDRDGRVEFGLDLARRGYADTGVARWLWVYSYQYAALAKAALLGCHRGDAGDRQFGLR